MEERKKFLEVRFEEYFREAGKDFQQIKKVIEEELNNYFDNVNRNFLSKGLFAHKLRITLAYKEVDFSKSEILEYLALKGMELSCLRGDFKNIDLFLVFAVGALRTITPDFFKVAENYVIAACLENPNYNMDKCFSITEDELIKSFKGRAKASEIILREIFKHDSKIAEEALRKGAHLTSMSREVRKLEGSHKENTDLQKTQDLIIKDVMSHQESLNWMIARCSTVSQDFRNNFLNLNIKELTEKFKNQHGLSEKNLYKIGSFIKNELFKIATADLKFLGKQIDFIAFLLREDNKAGLAKIWPDGNQLKEILIKNNLEADTTAGVFGVIEGLADSEIKDLVMVPEIDSTKGDDPVLTTAGSSHDDIHN